MKVVQENTIIAGRCFRKGDLVQHKDSGCYYIVYGVAKSRLNLVAAVSGDLYPSCDASQFRLVEGDVTFSNT